MIDGDRVVHEARYPYPIERVWRALTEPAELAAWLMPNDFVSEPGARFRLDARPAHETPFECEVLEIDAPRLLRQRWIVGGTPTTVTYELWKEGDTTVLRVEHVGPPPEEQPEFDRGWPTKLDRDIPLVLDGTRAATDATTTSEGLVTHPTL